MALNDIVSFLLTVGLSLASEVSEQQQQEDPEGRRLFDTDSDQTVTIGMASITTILLAGLIGVLLAGVIGIFTSRDEDASSGYGASSGYAATTAYEKSYAVQRSLDHGTAKYE